jgi:Fe-S cluster biogenesis protein NfuA
MQKEKKENAAPRQVTIYTESNPNPNSMKFVANFMLVNDGSSHDFPNKKAAENAPLAKRLFENFNFIDRVFYMSNFVTVTKTEEVAWEDARILVSQFIKEHLEKQEPLLAEFEEEEDHDHDHDHHDNENDDPIVAQIKDVLDEYIKPAVEMDGGAITFDSYNDGIVKVLLQGSCSGCPSSTVTLKAGIESLLKRAIPEIQSVEATEV